MNFIKKMCSRITNEFPNNNSPVIFTENNQQYMVYDE